MERFFETVLRSMKVLDGFRCGVAVLGREFWSIDSAEACNRFDKQAASDT